MFGFLQRANPPARRFTYLESLLLVSAIHIPMTLLFIEILVKSMSWETFLDGPMFMYSGFLMDHFGMAPMRDFFTYNMPGTHVLFRWLYHFFGNSILGMRLADTTILAAVLLLFALVLKTFGWRVAWAGAVLFGILHVTLGMHCYLQRDYIGLVPLQLAILASTAWFEKKPRRRWLATGLFVGLLATIKPHLMIGGLLLYGYLLLDTNDDSPIPKRDRLIRAARILCWCGIGASIPALWMAAYLAYYGQLAAFIRVVAEYFPMHADISGEHVVFVKGDKLPYVIAHLFKDTAWDHLQIALGAGAGVSLFLAAPTVPKSLRKYGGLLALLGLTFLIYPCIAARFYEHHYYPFRLLSTVWVAFCLYQWNTETPLRIRLCAWSISVYVIASLLYVNHNEDELLLPLSRSTGYFRTQVIVNWLRPRIQPGDTAQPIEWGFCGISHALLLTETKLATHTIWGEVFFHHVSNPFVQDLRKDFVQQLATSKPRFVIRSKTQMDYVDGEDCTEYFPGFDAFLSEHYFLALDTKNFRIWESNSSPTAAKDRELYTQSVAATDVGPSDSKDANDRTIR